MKNPKVTIIIPLYNGSKYVKEAITSALNQTYKNIEIIVVNDGSNDRGKGCKIVKSFGDRVRYYEKPNGGVSTALNLALTKMTGDYFSWLSHDDRYYPNKIESQINYLKDYDENTILYSDYDLMNTYSDLFSISKKNHEALEQNPEYGLLRGAINGITLLIPKKAFDDCGFFREDLRCTQDYEMWRRMMYKYKFVHQPEILATTRLHPEQTTNTSPRVIEEGDKLWIDIIESFSLEDKKRIDGTEYAYYHEMLKFLKEYTPYTGAQAYIQGKMDDMEKSLSDNVKSTKVSVIIPFYNRINLLKMAINSALQQTIAPYEIILVNDGSKDLEDLEEFIEGKRIILINSEENLGASAARNIGIQHATGDYIAFLDSDDLFCKNKIERQLVYMMARESDFGCTQYIRNYQGKKEEVRCFENVSNLIGTSCRIATPTVMIKRSFLEEHGLSYNTNYIYGEDICFYLDIFKHTKPAVSDEFLSVVNVGENSAAVDTKKQMIGNKTILTYLFNSSCYTNCDEALAEICYAYYTCVNVVYGNPVDLSQPTRFNKYLRALKKKGPVYCIKKVFEKLINKLKRL